ncbi:MAG: hypothetical protein K2X87_21095 [Gemmataceae bacterium]|nr:hypothetical protein [Gemmataceae bacterium]
MGHVRVGTLPRTRRWGQVVELVGLGAGAAQVAAAVLHAAGRHLAAAHQDPGVVEAVRLLMLLPLAGRADDLAGALRGVGLAVPDDPGLVDVLAAATAAVDAATPGNRGRTDLSDLARSALGGTLVEVVGEHLHTLLGPDPADVPRALGRYATPKQFGALAHEFFARFLTRFLDYHLSKTLPLHVGPGKRFDSLAAVERLGRELAHHCRERTLILRDFAGDWWSKERWEGGGEFDRGRVRAFVYGAVAKLAAELRWEGPAR